MKIEDIKLVREKTNAPVTLVKEALLNNHNADEAIEWISKNWKPKDKLTPFGRIHTYVHQGRIGVMLEVRCGTDFVANTEEFTKLCAELAYQAVAGLEGDLVEQDYVRDPSVKVQTLIDEVSKKTRETIKLERYVRWQV